MHAENTIFVDVMAYSRGMFFFFQAEDGIRDKLVTGVQTCALPIWHLDVVLVWRYDRFARSTSALVNALQEFHRLGIDFISYQEHIDTTTPQGELIFTVMASLAQFESALMSERVKAGMARAKAQGKRISRAPIARPIQTRIARLYAQGTSISHISKQLGIGYGTAWNYVQRLKATETGTARQRGRVQKGSP